jgi:ATP:ADP antiporter, AAA family
MSDARQLSRFERLLSGFTRVQPGEGRCVALLCLQAFTLMVAYYLIRPVREALILTEGGAELRSYAVGAQALLLLLIIPAYGALVRRVEPSLVFQRICGFFALNLVVLTVLGQAGVRLGFVFFIWASIFGVMVVAQFWAFATHLFNVRSGHRLFGIIAVGVSGGAVVGSRIAAAGFELLGAYGLMLASAAALVGAAVLSRLSHAAVPAQSRSLDGERPALASDRTGRRLGGFALIARSRYLVCIAALVVLLNWITSAGEYVLSDWLVESARTMAPQAQSMFIGRFMGNYSASITLLGLLIQVLLVSRIIVIAGIVRALMVTPIAFLAGYLLIGVVPVFALVQSVLVVQRSLDYSLLNTARSALLLPTSSEVKYQAKTTIDTFFYRLGDLLATLSIVAGLRLFPDSRMQFVWLLLVLSATMTIVAWLVGREYSRRYDPARASAPAGDTRGMALQH